MHSMIISVKNVRNLYIFFGTCFYILRKFQENIHATVTLLLLFMFFSILLKKLLLLLFFFLPWAHINFIKGGRDVGKKGGKKKRGRDWEREEDRDKTEMQKKKGESRRKTQPTTNQPTGVTWQLGFSRHRKLFCWKNYRNLHYRRTLTMCEGKSLPMITKRSFSGEH